MAKQESKNEKPTDKTVVEKSLRDACKNIRKISYVSESVFTTLKTSKKEAILKELGELNKIANTL
jgi:hypothetical protein